MICVGNANRHIQLVCEKVKVYKVMCIHPNKATYWDTPTMDTLIRNIPTWDRSTSDKPTRDKLLYDRPMWDIPTWEISST